MLRRKFIQNLLWLSGGVMITSCFPEKGLVGNIKKVKGSVLSAGRGVKGVVVSDGYNVIATGDSGKYEFEKHPDAVAVFISIPSGYAFENEKGIARHYRLLNNVSGGNEFDFNIYPLNASDDEHQFIIWADPQVKNQSDIQKMMNESVPDVVKYVKSQPAGTLIHGITVGDIVWDELQLLKDYNYAVEKMGIPFFQCLGNHDMDYNKGGDDASDDTFQQTYGPTYYSFNRGQVHYVVMDNVRYLGQDRNYDGYIQQNQLDWLKNDLSFVPADKLIVLSVHIPVHRAVKNKEELYAILGDRPVHIMSGHTHYHVNHIENNIYEHNHGTVCGAWWTGPICVDGTPGGYGIYKVNGNNISWHYKSTGYDNEHQMKLYIKPFDGQHRQVVANIWNYDPEWKNVLWIDGVRSGTLQQFEGYDPMAYDTLLGPDLPKPRGFAEPQLTKHLFKALIPVGAKEIKVIVTDRFGNEFTKTEKISG
jgi:hypothetical protein